MKVLIDSDALFALYVATDARHNKAKRIFKRLLDQKTELTITNLVIQETAAVISYKAGQKQAKDFLKRLAKITIKQVFINEKLTAKTWRFFERQEKKGTSYVDCANAIFYKELKIDAIFSFDKFYTRKDLKAVF